jgi:hypothetical protein
MNHHASNYQENDQETNQGSVEVAQFAATVLRKLFRLYGLPQGLRVDNGSPLGSGSDLPTDLALWLIGLGVDMPWNHPNRPQENGVVERSQGTGQCWAEPNACSSVRQ